MSSPETLFGPFRFNPARGLLWQGEMPIQLGARALAILIALLETPGQLVSKETLFKRAWPGLTVDEGNLRVQISGLRRALKNHGNLIRTEALLGYRFVGEVTMCHPAIAPAAKRRFRAPRATAIPLGRDDVVGSI